VHCAAAPKSALLRRCSMTLFIWLASIAPPLALRLCHPLPSITCSARFDPVFLGIWTPETVQTHGRVSQILVRPKMPWTLAALRTIPISRSLCGNPFWRNSDDHQKGTVLTRLIELQWVFRLRVLVSVQVAKVMNLTILQNVLALTCHIAQMCIPFGRKPVDGIARDHPGWISARC